MDGEASICVCIHVYTLVQDRLNSFMDVCARKDMVVDMGLDMDRHVDAYGDRLYLLMCVVM